MTPYLFLVETFNGLKTIRIAETDWHDPAAVTIDDAGIQAYFFDHARDAQGIPFNPEFASPAAIYHALCANEYYQSPLILGVTVALGEVPEEEDLVLESGDLRTENISAEENRERGDDSLKWVLDRQTDQKQAMHRRNIGWIAFLWGSAGSAPGFEDGDGISRIIATQDAKRKDDSTLVPGRRLIESAPEIIAKGRIARKYGSPGDTKIDISYNRNVVTLKWDKARRTLYLRDIRVEVQSFIMESAGEDDFSRIIEEIREAQDLEGLKSAFKKADGVLSEKFERDLTGFAAQLDKWEKGELPMRKPVFVCDTPPVLLALGVEPLEITINPNTISKVNLPDSEATGKHGIALDLIKQIPRQIADPVMVFDSNTTHGSLVVMTELSNNGKTIVAAIHLSKRAGRHTVNEITSIHPRKNDSHFSNWIEKGLLRYINKNKSLDWFQSRGLQLPSEETIKALSERNVVYNTDIVNDSDDSVFESASAKSPSKFKKKEKYKLQDSYQFMGLNIAVENKAGSVRRGVDPDGHEWECKMHFDYGFIKKTEGEDGEGIDCYIGERPSNKVYIVKQHKIEAVKKWKTEYCPSCEEHVHDCGCSDFYDEDKVMLGFSSKQAAKEAYLKQYDSPLFLGPISSISLQAFHDLFKETKKPDIPWQLVAESAGEKNGWIGFDLDGTLAEDDGWKGPEYIGKPIEKMMEIARKLKDNGHEIRLFTARASDPTQVVYVEKWLEENGLDIKITNKKDHLLKYFFDDRAVAVEKNTGAFFTYFKEENGQLVV